MCGICGVVGHADHGAITAMNARLSHRGPDDEGIYVDQRAKMALGHKRLSILDLSAAGRQPMHNDDRSLTIVFNGEIYNYRELRARLIAQGFSFHSNTDTEVILKLYQAEGPGFVKSLNGIFAFAIWDARRDALFLARDHFGTKPLY